MKMYYYRIVVICSLLSVASALWCYECVSTQPGCGTPFNWLWHWTKICPEDDDICVKIIEKKEADVIITRSCLSSLRALRTDIPADHYEGCRLAAKDLNLGHYVNNSIKELDIYRNYYDETMYCFCFLDNRCNSSYANFPSRVLLIIASIIPFLFMFR